MKFVVHLSNGTIITVIASCIDEALKKNKNKDVRMVSFKTPTLVEANSYRGVF